LILNHLPLLIISIPYGFIIPLLNVIIDKGFLFLLSLSSSSSSSQFIHRNNYSIMKHNDNFISSSTWIMNVSTLFILSIAWLLTESLAVLLLSLLLLMNNILFDQQNYIKNIQKSLCNHNPFIQLINNNNDNNQYQIIKYQLKLYYLIKCRLFILLLIINLLMLNDWILFIERIQLLDYYNISSFFLHYSSILQLHHIISSTFILLCTSICISSSTWIMNVSTLFILSIAWLLTESLAVLLLSLLLLMNNILFDQQNYIKNIQKSLCNHNPFIQLINNNNDNNQYQIIKYQLKLYYLIKCRLFILLLIINLLMLNDWILFIERIQLLDYYNISSFFLHYSSILQLHHIISSTFILLCTSIWLLQFGIVHIIQSSSSSSSCSSSSPSPSSSSPSSSSSSTQSSSLLLFYGCHSNKHFNINTTNHFPLYKFLIFCCQFIIICLLFNLFNLAKSFHKMIQFTIFSLECISLMLWFSCKSYSMKIKN
ncbi:uncharacterized protein DC041_0011557, partial [Schistosoma bovis]